jgi:acetyl/propionyl-CoA carboxylase alpha subunit
MEMKTLLQVEQPVTEQVREGAELLTFAES